jgi:hypothetical protein
LARNNFKSTNVANGKREVNNTADYGKEVKMDRAHLEERFTSDRETSCQL